MDYYLPPEDYKKSPLMDLYNQDPMRAINQKFGPMTPRTQGGLQQGMLTAGHLPTMQEQVLSAILNYGPIPAQIATNIAMQPVTAGNALGEALADPSLGKITNAGTQTAMALMAPTKAVGALATGYGIAGARDMGLFGSAEAAGLTPQQEARKAELQKQIGAQKWKSGAERRSVESELNDLRAIETEAAKSANAAEIERQKQADAQRQGEYNSAVDTATSLRDAERKRDRRWSETEVGKVYNQTGGAPVIAAALAGGAGIIDRLAKGAPKTGWDYARVGAEGMGAASLGINAPLAYDAFATESDNPERRALEVYARELPSTHPQKAYWQQQAQAQPERNPVKAAAQSELYDPVKVLERIGMAAIEGVPMGITGSNIPGALKAIGGGAKGAVSGTAETIGALPGNMATGYQRGIGAAATERGNAATAQRAAADSQALALEAQRRLGAQRASPQPAQSFAAEQGQLVPPVQSQRQLPPPVSAQNQPSQAPQNNGLIIPDSITGNKSRANKTYAEQNSPDMQAYVIGKAEQGVSPSALVGTKVAKDLGIDQVTRARNALQNLKEIGAANGLDISDPKVLKAIAAELNASPAYRNKKGAGNALFSAGAAGGIGASLWGDENK